VAMIQDEDFPVLTRSRRVSPKILTILKRIDTIIVRRTKATEALLTEIQETELAALPQVVEEVCGPNHPELVKVLHLLAVFYHSLYTLGKAESLYRNALACAERAFPEPNLELGLILNNLGRLLYDQKKLTEAEELYRQSLLVLQKAVGPDHPKLGTPMNNLANLYMDLGKLELAKSLQRDSITILEKALGPTHRKVVKAKKRLSHLMQVDAWSSQ